MLGEADRTTVQGPARVLGLGQTVGPFRVEGVIGQGGMAVVYVARDQTTGDRAALKVLRRDALRQPDLVRRFEQEAELLAALRHPALVRLLRRGAEGDVPWLALELVQGVPFEDMLRGRTLELGRGVALLARVARAVAYLHDSGVVHRDLSARNVLVAEDDSPRIIDLGLAVRLSSPRLTQDGAVLGSSDVMSPEQLLGDPRAITPSADVYALGALLYRLIAGKPPRGPASLAVARLERSQELGPLAAIVSSVPPALDALCRQALSLTPADRPEALELASALEAWLGAVPRGAEKTTTASRRPGGDTRAPPQPGGPQSHIVGGFLLERLLAKGGMGAVYVARQPETGRRVALKVVPVGSSDRLARRFEREVDALGRLRHSNLVDVHAAGIDGDMGFIAMSYLEGGSLEARLAAGPMTPAEAARVVRDAARGVAHAHARGVVHRDLKPANVLFDREGTVRVVDFGVARLAEPQGAGGALTLDGALVGTPAYAAPELLTADRAGVGPPTDVFSLGVILYELLTGRPPFHGNNLVELTAAVLAGRPPPPSRSRRGVPPCLDAVCLRALAVSPEDRHPDARALAEDLEDVLAAKPSRSRALRTARLLSLSSGLLAAGAIVWTIRAGSSRAATEEIQGHAPVSADARADHVDAPPLGQGPGLAGARRALELSCPEDAVDVSSQLGAEERRWLETVVTFELLGPGEPATADAAARRATRLREVLALAMVTADDRAAEQALRAVESANSAAVQVLGDELPVWKAWLVARARGERAGRPVPGARARALVALPSELGLAWDAEDTSDALGAIEQAARAAEEVGALSRALALRAEALAAHPLAHELRFEHARALGMDRRPGEALLALCLVTAGEPGRLGGSRTRVVRLHQQNGTDAVHDGVAALPEPLAGAARALLGAYQALLGPRLDRDGFGSDGAPADIDWLSLHGDAHAAVERSPSWFAMRAVRGLARLHLGLPRAAARDFEAFLLTARGQAHAHVFVAGCLASARDDAAALTQLELAAAIDLEEPIKWRDSWCFRSLTETPRFDAVTRGR